MVLGIIAVMAASVLYGLLPVFTKVLIENGMNSDSIVMFRFLFASVFCGMILILKKRSNMKATLKQLAELAFFGIIGFGLTATFLTISYHSLSIGLATMLHFSYPVFVKPVRGSASIHINKVSSRKEIEVLFDLYDNLMIQEYMDGQEYGADVYIDMISGKCTDIFVKKKIKMRAGETDKSVSYKDEALFAMIQKFVEECGFRGMIDIDIFEINGTYYLSEVNPRFGGGYPHAYACGVNMPAAVIRNLAGAENAVTIGAYSENICMMKYNEIAIRDMNGIEIVP